jgi:hypothetical protein
VLHPAKFAHWASALRQVCLRMDRLMACLAMSRHVWLQSHHTTHHIHHLSSQSQKDDQQK